MVGLLLNAEGKVLAADLPTMKTVLLVCLVSISFVSALSASEWSVHPDHGTPVLSTELEAHPASVLGKKRASQGFHERIHVHAGVDDFPELGGEAAVRAARVSPSAIDGFHVVPMHGGMVKVGEYYARIKLGGQMVRTQIDTGSATLAAPMGTCHNCLRGDHRYKLSASVGGKGEVISCGDDSICTRNKCSPSKCGGCSPLRACCAKLRKDQCGFHLHFGDGSGAEGFLVRDEMEWGGLSFPVVFGGINQDSPDFERPQVDGILGMAYPRLACNPSCVKPVFESMVEHLRMRKVFQICITADSGKIVLGDWDKSLMREPPKWVDMALSQPATYYSVKLSGKLMVNSRPLDLPEYNTAVVDSGTTLLVFSSAAFEALKKHLQTYYCDVPGLCGMFTWFRPGHCARIPAASRRKLPTLRFKLAGGFVVLIGPDDYLIHNGAHGPETWCVGIMALPGFGGGIDVIFGNTVMKKYVTIYDRERSRLGFGLSNGDCKSRSASK